MGLVQLKDKNDNQLLPLTTASGVKYDSSKSKLEAVSVQDAIDLTASKLNYKKVITSPCIRGYWRKTDVGTVGTVFNPAVYNYGNSISTNARRTKIEVTGGDKIYIDHLYMATSSGPAWIIVDENNVILKKATVSNYTNLALSIPTNAKMVYIQNDASHYSTVEIYKYIAVPDEKDIDKGWETVPYKATRTGTVYTFNKNVGEKFEFASSGSLLYGMWYKVCPKDKIRLTLQVLPENTYSYYILGRDDIIIKAGETPSDRMLVDEEFEVPMGAECLVLSTYPKSHIVKINRSNENNVNDDYKEKDSLLMAINENQNDVSGERARTLKKRLTLAWCSDTHDDRDNYRRFVDYVNGHQGIIDAVIHTGDMNRMSDTDYGFNNTILKYPTICPFIPVMGNHDSHGGSTETAEMLVSGSQAWQANKYVVPFMDENCVRGTDNCYFYRDFDEYKIRIICLNDYDMPRYVNVTNWATTTDPDEIASAVDWESGITYDSGAVINYKGLYLKAKVQTTLDTNGDRYSYSTNAPWSRFSCVGRYYQRAQVDWFINALTDPKLTSEWGIIIATHMPQDACTTANILDANWTDKRREYLAVKVSQDGWILSDIIQAFLDRTTIDHTYHAIKPDTTPEKNTLINNTTLVPDVHVVGDFTNTSAHIICVMSGHTHQHGCYKSSKVTGHKVINLVMETSCYAPDSVAIPGGAFTRWGVSDVVRGGNYAKDCFNIISFDTVNKYIYLMRIGADTTDILNKRDVTRISYIDEV